MMWASTRARSARPGCRCTRWWWRFGRNTNRWSCCRRWCSVARCLRFSWSGFGCGNRCSRWRCRWCSCRRVLTKLLLLLFLNAVRFHKELLLLCLNETNRFSQFLSSSTRACQVLLNGWRNWRNWGCTGCRGSQRCLGWTTRSLWSSLGTELRGGFDSCVFRMCRRLCHCSRSRRLRCMKR